MRKEKLEITNQSFGQLETMVIPPIADVCCASKSFWFDKEDERVLFFDKRNDSYPIKSDKGHPARTIIVSPEIVMDFENIPIKNNIFSLVVFDPPHARFGLTSVMAKTYGSLFGNWQSMLKNGFSECFRILKSGGILIFKWNEFEIPVKKILELTNQKPLFGHISGKRADTHWITFMKAV